MKRKRIQADFARHMDEGGKDTYVYTGPKYSLTLSPEARKRYILACWTVPVLALAMFVLMGLLDTQGSRVPYVALPYVGIFLPVCMLLGDAYKVTVAKAEMRRAEYERGVLQMRRCTIAAIILSGATLLGQAVFMIFGGAGDMAREWIFLGYAVAVDALLIVFLCYQKRIPVQIRR